MKNTSKLNKALLAGIVAFSAGGVLVTPYMSNSALAAPVRVEAGQQAPSFSNVVTAVSPAVVSVRVEGVKQTAQRSNSRNRQQEIPEQFRGTPFERFFQDQFSQRERAPEQRRTASQGSGFFISDDGLVVTNHHVVNGGEKFTVVLNDGETYDAKLIGTDERTDLAVLKVEAKEKFTYVDFAPDDAASVGDWVVAVGNPFGLGGTVTAGIVSARGRDIGAGPYDDFLQIDAAVNRGNSGGPAFNLKGEVIGVNTAIYSPSGGNVGIAFAIPAETTKAIVADLIDDGSVARGWLGVQIGAVNADMADALGLEDARGAIISEATENGPAQKAGLKSGDVVLGVNDAQIDDPKDLAKTIAQISPNSDAELTIWRNGDAENLTVKLGELPNSKSELAAALNSGAQNGDERLGLTLQKTENGELQVADVDPDSEAAKRGFRPGDIIEKVNGRSVKNAKAISKAIKIAKKAGRGSVLFQLSSPNGTKFAALPIAENG